MKKVFFLLLVLLSPSAFADTFGNATTSANHASGGFLCSSFTVPANGTLTSVTGGLWKSPSVNVIFGVYDNAGAAGIPGNLLASDTAGVASPTVSGAETSNALSLSITNGSILFLCEQASVSATYNTVDSGNSTYVGTSVYPTPNNPYVNSSTLLNRNLSIFATYTPGGAGTVINETRRTIRSGDGD